jgi:hypothetical protein
MILWLWPGIALVDAAIIATLPHAGWWIAVTATILALLAELQISGMKPASLMLPAALLAISASIIYVSEHG